jgi:undecaprenyl-diphosphatase
MSRRGTGRRASGATADRAIGLNWLRGRAAAKDRAIMARVSETPSAALDELMPRLSTAANHGVLWLCVATGLLLAGDQRAARAAWRGLAGLAVASTASNVIGKSLTGRARPSGRIPAARRLSRGPRTTSFPSGHAASAAAFTTGVALELPAAAVPVGALAAAVGASRVVTGMHYPSDVAAGFATGIAAGLLTLALRPRRPGRRGASAPRP